MTRRSIARRASEAALAGMLLAAPSSTAVAADPAAEPEVRQTRSSREILMRADLERSANHSWLGPNFHLQELSGFGYARKLKWGDRPLLLQLRGPIMRKQKALGIRFKLSF